MLEQYQQRAARLVPHGRVRWLLLAVVAVGLLVAPFVGSQFVLSFLLGSFVFMSLAIGFNIIAGYAGQFSLGHVLFYGIGGYAAVFSVSEFGLHWLVAVVFATVVSVVAAAAIGYVTLRLHGLFFAFGTLGAAEFVRRLALNVDALGGGRGLIVSASALGYSAEKFYYAALAVLALGVALNVFIDRSLFGTRLEAIRDDKPKAATVGTNTWLYKNLAFVLSAVVPAAAGAIHAFYLLSVEPNSAFSANASITMQLMVILGGLGTVFGPLVGGAVFYAVREYASYTFPQLHFIVTGGLLILLILYMPQGIVPTLEDRLP